MHSENYYKGTSVFCKVSAFSNFFHELNHLSASLCSPSLLKHFKTSLRHPLGCSLMSLPPCSTDGFSSIHLFLTTFSYPHALLPILLIQGLVQVQNKLSETKKKKKMSRSGVSISKMKVNSVHISCAQMTEHSSGAGTGWESSTATAWLSPGAKELLKISFLQQVIEFSSKHPIKQLSKLLNR